MSEPSATLHQAEEVRRETISLLDDLVQKAREFKLPRPPEALEHYRKRLVENAYKMLVVGEAKRGKSTFVNALIGQDILPTDVRVTTSQIFNVRPAEREAYRLRFEDSSMREISYEDLPRYGSQMLEDAGSKPQIDQVIHWIEVDAPDVRFLPEGMSLIDTPGFGALDTGQATGEIVYRYVPQVDAVIFVLDSDHPITQIEVEFIESVLDVTRDIFFVQTKTSKYSPEHWQNIQHRNQEILKGRFGGRLAEARVWPMDSKLLLAAAAGGEEAKEGLEDSLYEQLEPALREFLFRVAGWGRIAEAVLAAGRYQAIASRTLSGRLAGLVEDREKREQMQRSAVQRGQRFQNDWGERGRKREKLLKDIRRVISVYKRSFEQSLHPGGTIDKDQRKTIADLKSLEEAQARRAAIPDEVCAAAAQQWWKVAQQCHVQCVESLIPFLKAAETVTLAQETNPSASTVVAPDESTRAFLEWAKRVAPSDLITTTDRHYYLPEGYLVPVENIAVAFAGLWAYTRLLVYRPTIPETPILRRLHENLTAVLKGVWHHFLEVGSSSDRYSRVDEFFGALERAASGKVQMVFEQKLKEAEAESYRLREAEDLDDEQRKTEIERTRRQLAEWDDIGEALEGAGARLDMLGRRQR